MRLAYFIDMLSMGVHTTRHWQTSGRLVQELNVGTIGVGRNKSPWREPPPDSTGNFLTCASRDSNPGRGERQRAVSGIAYDNLAIRAEALCGMRTFETMIGNCGGLSRGNHRLMARSCQPSHMPRGQLSHMP